MNLIPIFGPDKCVVSDVIKRSNDQVMGFLVAKCFHKAAFHTLHCECINFPNILVPFKEQVVIIIFTIRVNFKD